MDQELLVEMIDDGKRFLDALVEGGIPFAAVCWLKRAEDRWRYYIATPLVPPEGGSRKAITRILDVLRQMPEPEMVWLRSDDLKIVSANDPLAQAVQRLRERYPDRPSMRYPPRHFSADVEGAYVYAPVSTSASQP